ncbi:hypothetical protein TNCV_1864921 [Trichonephila clavipes]|nr:hypothetical protein TNCV_1864921 [Trichonephila clavipes]
MVALELRVIRSCVRHFPGPSRVNVPSADRFPEEVGFFGKSPVLTRDGEIAPKPVVEVDGGIVESVLSDQFELDVMLTRRPNRENLKFPMLSWSNSISPLLHLSSRCDQREITNM